MGIPVRLFFQLSTLAPMPQMQGNRRNARSFEESRAGAGLVTFVDRRSLRGILSMSVPLERGTENAVEAKQVSRPWPRQTKSKR